MTWNKDRKQTIYGHMRWEHMTHTTEPWHNSPLPEGVSHAVTVPPGRGGGRSGGPSGQTRTGTQDGDLQSGTDNGDYGGAGSSGGHGGAGRWTRSTGLGIAAVGGHESAPIRRAWVSSDLAGIESEVGLESEAGRRALSQRRAGGVISRERRAPGGAATRELGNPLAGLGEPPPAADISHDRRAWGLAARGLAAIPPNSHAVLQWAMAGGRVATSLPRDKQTEAKQKTFKNGKQNWVNGRRLRFRSGLLSRCTHEGGTGPLRREYKLK